MLELIDSLVDYRSIEETISQKLKNLLTNPEILYCVQKDLICVLEYYEEELRNDGVVGGLHVLKKDINGILEEQQKRFDSLKSKLNHLTTPKPYTGIVVRFKINNSDSNSQILYRYHKQLEKYLRTRLKYEFNDLHHYHDGYIFIKYDLEEEKVHIFLIRLFKKLKFILQDLEEKQTNQSEKLQLGIGIAYGGFTICNPSEEADYSYFCGEAFSKASKMCHFAKPKGIVVFNSNNFKACILRREFDLEIVSINDKNNNYSCFISNEVILENNCKYLFRYFDKDNNKKNLRKTIFYKLW